MSNPQIIQDTEIQNLELAYAHDANAESVRLVLDAGADTPDGRSGWKWLRLRNGDLLLGVFPRGATYEATEVDAQFPGAPAADFFPERPVPIPEGWKVIAYRVPKIDEQYFSAADRSIPWRKSGEYSATPGDKWIVVPA